jgi:hypothetical protein
MRKGSRTRFVGRRPGTQVRWQANRHLCFQADYGIFYAGKFLKESSPCRNLNYQALWAVYEFLKENYRPALLSNGAACHFLFRLSLELDSVANFGI